MLLGIAIHSCLLAPVRGEEIDRLVAAVNGVAITEGDLHVARSLNSIILNSRNPAAESRSEEIDRLIDQELMRQELKNFSITEEDAGKVEARMQILRASFAGKGGLSALLSQVGLQESELMSYLQLESSVAKFVNFRFRPFVSVAAEEIQAYFENRLVPQLRKSKIELPELTQVAAKIEAILKEEKINVVLDQWMRDIRRNSRIEYFNAPE